MKESDFSHCKGDSPFCFGMVDFDCCGVDGDRTSDNDFKSSVDPPAKCSKLSLWERKSVSERFGKKCFQN